MLYKKYHKNFVRQFKEGVKIVLDCSEFIVDSSPFVDCSYYNYNLPTAVIMVGLCRLPIGDKCMCCCMNLVYSNGKLRPLCHVI